MFSFTFTAIKKNPTVDHLENARIKHYLTCYVYKKTGLLSRERVIEKNQFQVPIKQASIEVDALFPDRFCSSIQSRPHSSNSAYYDFRARCSTHLLPGLPFLVEVDMAQEAEIDSITLSLHQSTVTSIGADEEEIARLSRYVHEATWPIARDTGHFRQRDSPRPWAFGRRSWLIEWICPNESARVPLPFEPTFYCKYAEANLERNLSLKVEVMLRGSPTKLAAVMHNLEYRPLWVDARKDKTTSLRAERSTLNTASPVPSMNADGRHDFSYDSRRGSVISSRSGRSAQDVYQMPAGQFFGSRQSPLTSPAYSTNRNAGDYFGDLTQRTRGNGPGTMDVKLSHGSYSPGAVHLFSRADSVRSNASSRHGSSLAGSARGHKSAPDKITLPPASVRASMSSAFESLNLRHSASSSISSPTRRHFDDLPSNPEAPAPPPSQPLPPAPTGVTGDSSLALRSSSPALSRSMSGVENAADEGLRLTVSRQKKPTRLSRPAVILGVSQDTIQTHENVPSTSNSAPSSASQGIPLGFTQPPAAFNNVYAGRHPSPKIADRDSGFSEASYVPGSPLSGKVSGYSGPVVSNTNGYARRPSQRVGASTDAGGEIMLG